MIRVLIPVASGFEDTELITTINILDRENITFDLWSPEGKGRVQAQRFAMVETITLVNFDDYDGIILPGGSGHKVLLESSRVFAALKHFSSEEKLIAAICAAPNVLQKANLLTSEYTSFPGETESLFKVDKEVVVSNNIITARDYLSTPNFAFAIVKYLKEHVIPE